MPPLDFSGLCRDERLGLALSGGGFRAAFFHLGVLARLADQDDLRRVEVISTVSGGSVIGAAYYLKLKRLLEEQNEPPPERYVQIVGELDLALRRAVAKGMRGRIFANPVKNLEMLLPFRLSRRSYSRTDRVGDLLDHHLYKGIFWGPGEAPKRGGGPLRCFRRGRQIELRELAIRPGGAPIKASLKEVNRNRKAKIPALVINATCLNTGHLWRFEAVRMGEHPLPGSEEDGNRVLPPAYFTVAGQPIDPSGTLVPEAQQDFPLGLAVAASAAVPGMFRALPISGLYANARVQLVDGGVADNQGIQALRDHGCGRMIVSDASGQMADLNRPRGSFLPVLIRSSGILRDRVRDLQFVPRVDGELDEVVHLRKGLAPPPAEMGSAWEEPVRRLPGEADPDWSIHPRALDALSRLRTDLDTFSQREVDALACCGYRSIAEQGGDTADGPWGFLAIGDALYAGEKDLVDHLVLGRRKFFRFLGPWLRLLRILGFVLVAALLVAALRVVDVAGVALPLAVALVAALLGPGALLLYRTVRAASRCLRGE